MSLSKMIPSRALAFVVGIALWAIAQAPDAATLTPDEVARIDKLVEATLAVTGVPSASVAIVRGGEISFAKAYGVRDFESKAAVTTTSRYRIGSISKQFTATAILLLADRGELSLDDQVSQYVPEVASQPATIRQALTHTAGFAEFWPTDYLLPALRRPTTPPAVARKWGAATPSFKPGAQWSYSNTGYNALGLIVERVSGLSLYEFLRQNVFAPLEMPTVIDVDGRPLPPSDTVGFERTADGPPRVAQQPARGWTFAAGDLAMTAEDLARWDLSLIQNRLLSMESVASQRSNQKLSDGSASGYGFGLFVDDVHGRPRLSHNGILPGFLSENRVYTTDGAAIVVLVSGSYGASPHTVIANGIEEMLFPSDPAAPPNKTPGSLVRMLMDQIAEDRLDRTVLTADADDYLRGEVLTDYRESFVRLGKPLAIVRQSSDVNSGVNVYQWLAVWPTASLVIILQTRSDGKVQEFYAYPVG